MTETAPRHRELAAGRWGRLSLAEQLANVGTRVIGTVLNDPDGAVARFSSSYDSYFEDYESDAPARV